jgi:hypothetical protein
MAQLYGHPAQEFRYLHIMLQEEALKIARGGERKTAPSSSQSKTPMWRSIVERIYLQKPKKQAN